MRQTLAIFLLVICFKSFLVVVDLSTFLFQEVFPAEYDLSYDADMQLLVWEFLSRLEQLVPVPDLSQVGSDITAHVQRLFHTAVCTILQLYYFYF